MSSPPSTISRERDLSPKVRSLLAVLGNLLVILLMISAAATGYLSSWLPSIVGFPVGAILRDGLAIVLVAMAAVLVLAGVRPTRDVATPARAAILPLALLAIWTLVLVPFGPSFAASILSARNLVLFMAVAVAVHALWRRELVSGQRTIAGFLTIALVAGILGLADTMTAGQIVTSFGYLRDFAGLPQGDGAVISGAAGAVGGIVRASGGISDALVFGYLMGLATLVGIWWAAHLYAAGARRLVIVLTVIAAAVTGAAMIESLTRGAWTGFVVGLAILVALRPSRAVLASAITAVSAAMIAVAVMSSAIPIVETNAGGGAIVPVASAEPGTAGQVVLDRVGSDDPASQLSSLMRIAQLKVGIATLSARPLGTGLGTEGAGADRAGAAAIKSTPDIYVMIVSLQAGLPGIALWLTIVGIAAWWVVRHRRSPGASLVGAAIGLLATASVLSHTPDAPPFAIFLWLIVLSAGAEAASERDSGPSSQALG